MLFALHCQCLQEAVHLLRLSARQCDANGLSIWNQEETNVTNYTVDLTHFLHFFSPHDVLRTR